MKTKISLRLPALIGAAIFALAASKANAATDVVASIPELGAIAKAVGGNDVAVYSIAKPNQDYHSIEPRPSDVSRISKAELVVRSGLSLDMWMDALMNAASNSKVNRGGSGYVDASSGIPTIEKPAGSISGASGDVHPEGNPHYLYDPVYAKFVARNVLKGLIRVDPKNANDYRANYASFNKTVDARMTKWQAEMKPYTGRKIVTYHRNYNYLLRRFGLVQYGTLEAKPGIPPSAAHISQLIANMKRDNVKAMLIESIYPTRYADLMARQLGVKYQVGPVSVSSMTQDGYLNMIDRLVDQMREAVN